MIDRRTILKGALAAGVLSRPAFAAGYPRVPFEALQQMADREVARARAQHGAQHGARLAVVLGVVNPRGNGQLFLAAAPDLTHPGGRPMTLDGGTPFAIGSISKVFTACLHYQAHGPFKGNLGDWLAPRALSPGLARIPLADIARYQSGMAQDNQGGVHPPGVMASFGTLFPYLATLRPPSPPGSCYSYSNLSWSLLALAGSGARQGSMVEAAERYDRALKTFGAGMGMTATGIFRSAMKPRLPAAYRRNWQPLPPAADYAPTRLTGVGAGGIVSTGSDMLAFLTASMGHGTAGMESPALAYQQGNIFSSPRCGGGKAPRTAYGWILHDVADASGPLALVTKDGAVAGFTAWMGFLAWQGTGAPSPFGVFALVNGPGAAGLGLRAMRRILVA